jgi:hypothetical protein
MKKLVGLRRRLTYANVIATLALFFAVGGGVAVAAPKFIAVGDPAGGDLTGTYPNPSIAANAVTGAKVLNNSLTGDDVDESTLGKVPSAAAADSAGDANTLDGIDSTGFLGVNAKAADSDKLDGLDSSAFLGVNAKAADSDKLDGKDSTDFGGLTKGIGFESDFLGVNITGPFVTVASSPTLAPGAYLVIGRAKVTNHPNADGVACRIKTLPDQTIRDVVIQNLLVDYVLPLVASFTLSAPASVIIECGGPSNATASAKADVLRLDAAG